MAERYQQQKKMIDQGSLFEHYLFSDYAFFKSLVFAGITLKDDELQLFKMLFHIIFPHIKIPDMVIYLHKPVSLLVSNIQKRGREYEKQISESYLQELNNAYMEFLKQVNTNVIILDTSHLDFVNNTAHFNYIKDIIENPPVKKISYL
ncbi:MAG: deoxynucleoside kinase [Chitinophagales bacterium]|nr:deoxynucleoside kinase [Chitinophagales bacterium]